MSGGGIYLIQGDALVEMREAPYDSERLLQELLARYPNLLAGDQMDAVKPRRWLLVEREKGVPREECGAGWWSLDHLFLDQDGVPTLVEVKQSTDTRIRREVVGQMLDYAANGVAYWPVESIRASFETRCERESISADGLLADLLGTEGDAESLWQSVKTNLEAGRIRLVFVADSIPPELRRVIEFLNSQMTPAEVLGLEVRQYVGEGLRTLVPQVIGKTARAEQVKGMRGQAAGRWDEASLLADLAKRRGATAVEVARSIIGWARQKGFREWWGTGLKDGSFVTGLEVAGNGCWPICMYSYGRIEVQFQHIMPRAPFDDAEKRLELVRRLNAIPGVTVPESAIERRPSIELEALQSKQALRGFLDAIEWVLAEFRAYWSVRDAGG